MNITENDLLKYIGVFNCNGNLNSDFKELRDNISISRLHPDGNR